MARIPLTHEVQVLRCLTSFNYALLSWVEGTRSRGMTQAIALSHHHASHHKFSQGLWASLPSRIRS